jgi:polysaccharide chain length determinant protein (PEP-CTERM system associated)
VTPQALVHEFVEHLRAGWRYRWRVAALSWLICVIGWAFVYTTPDVYKASARVYVDTETLLGPLMQGLTAQQNTLTEVQLVSRAVLSRPNLEMVAHDTDLALRTSSTEEFERLITALQERIVVRGGLDNIFTIEYEDVSREMARRVVAAILATFVEGGLRAQGDDADVSEQALDGEIDEHVRRLNVAEAALAAFKKDNVGYMPGESGDYYNQLQTALASVASAESEVREIGERRNELARQVEGEEPVFGLVTSVGTSGGCAESGRLAELSGQRAALLVDFTEKHPRVVALSDQIAALEERCAAAGSTGELSAPGSDDLALNPVYQNLRLQLSNTEIELVEARGRLRTHEATVARLRADVDKIALVEAQLKQLNRDYDVVVARHQELLRRWEDLQTKKRIDPVTDDVQFQTIEPPFALPKPVAPNRPLLLGAVLAFAIAAGAALAVALSQLHPVYWSRRQLAQLSGLPVLGSIMEFRDEHAERRARREVLVWFGAYALLLVSAIAVVIFASQGSALVRSMLGSTTV